VSTGMPSENDNSACRPARRQNSDKAPQQSRRSRLPCQTG